MSAGRDAAGRAGRRWGVALALLGGGLALGSDARAQVFRTRERAGALLPLARDPAAQPRPLVFSSRDDGDAEVRLPFDFFFLGERHRALRVGTNGYVTFGGGRATRYFNRRLGSLTSPDRIIAPWWDDLVLPSASGYADTAVIGAAPRRVFVIEVRSLEDHPLNRNAEITWQLRLHEGPEGRFEVRWAGAPTERYSATTGYVGPGGRVQEGFRSCATSAACSATDFGTLAGRAVEVSQAPGPDLTVAIGPAPAGALPGGQAPWPLTIENRGTASAPGSVTAVYLSSDAQLDAGDPEVGRLSIPTLGARATWTRTATLSLPAGFALGTYRLFARADTTGVVTEPGESDNVALAEAPFEVGHDLRVDAVRPAAGAAAPGARLAVDVDLSEAGLPFGSAFDVVLYASPNRVPASTDPVIARQRAQVSLPGTLRLEGPVPTGAGRRFWPAVVVDPDRRVVDRDRSNQAGLSDDPVLTRPNLVLARVEPTASAPGRLDARLEVANPGVPHTGAVAVDLFASADAILDLSDRSLGRSQVQLTGQASETFEIRAPLPNLPLGYYHVAARVDATDQVAETVEGDNLGISRPRFANAADLAVGWVSGPSTTGPGERLTASAEIQSRGRRYSGPVIARWWLSLDERLDPSDVDLGAFTFDLAGEARRRVSPSSRLPATLAPRRYWILMRVDDAAQVAEADETNNLGVSGFRVDARYDLRPTRVRYTPEAVDPGDTVNVDFRVQSFPAAYRGPVGYRAFLSLDTDLDEADLLVDSATLTASAQVNEVARSFTLSSSIAPGGYRVFVEVDPGDRIPEIRETNNDTYGFGRLAIRGPDLAPETLGVSGRLVAGSVLDAALSLSNRGTRAVSGASYAYELLVSGAAPRRLETARGVDVAAGGRVARRDRVRLPAGLAGSAELFVIADPDGAVAELEEGNNRLATSLAIQPRQADLRPVRVRAATAAAAGEPLAVEWAVENAGVERGAARVALELEGAEGSTRIATASVSLDAGALVLETTEAVLPAEMSPGPARLVALADPDGRLPELDETNNRAAGPEVAVAPASLAIRTQRLAPAFVGRDYAARLVAVGGAGPRRWSIPAGDLPAGLTLSPDGQLSGRPTAAGRRAFVARVTSAGEVAERRLALDVRQAGAPLRLLGRRLAPAYVGRPYTSRVVVSGGLPPVEVTAEGLPRGLSLSPEGVISGASELPFRGIVTLRAEDAAGDRAEARVGFAVLDPEQRVTITPAPFPPARLGRAYCADGPVELFAVGGIPPLRWRAGGLPAGLAVSPGGELCGTPTALGRFRIRLEVEDAVGGVDTAAVPLDVVPEDTLVLTTAALPAADVGEPVRFLLRAEGGTPPLAFARVTGELPPGLSLAEEGVISGEPSAPGLHAFGVEVRDANGATDLAPLSIEVRATAGGGCRCARPGGAGARRGLGLLAALVAGAVGGRARRARRRPRRVSAWSAAARGEVEERRRPGGRGLRSGP